MRLPRFHSFHKIIFFICAFAAFLGQAANAATIRCGTTFDVDGTLLTLAGTEMVVSSGLPYRRVIGRDRLDDIYGDVSRAIGNTNTDDAEVRTALAGKLKVKEAEVTDEVLLAWYDIVFENMVGRNANSRFGKLLHPKLVALSTSIAQRHLSNATADPIFRATIGYIGGLRDIGFERAEIAALPPNQVIARVIEKVAKRLGISVATLTELSHKWYALMLEENTGFANRALLVAELTHLGTGPLGKTWQHALSAQLAQLAELHGRAVETWVFLDRQNIPRLQSIPDFLVRQAGSGQQGLAAVSVWEYAEIERKTGFLGGVQKEPTVALIPIYDVLDTRPIDLEDGSPPKSYLEMKAEGKLNEALFLAGLVHPRPVIAEVVFHVSQAFQASQVASGLPTLIASLDAELGETLGAVAGYRVRLLIEKNDTPRVPLWQAFSLPIIATSPIRTESLLFR